MKKVRSWRTWKLCTVGLSVCRYGTSEWISFPRVSRWVTTRTCSHELRYMMILSAKILLLIVSYRKTRTKRIAIFPSIASQNQRVLAVLEMRISSLREMQVDGANLFLVFPPELTMLFCLPDWTIRIFSEFREKFDKKDRIYWRFLNYFMNLLFANFLLILICFIATDSSIIFGHDVILIRLHTVIVFLEFHLLSWNYSNRQNVHSTYVTTRLLMTFST